VPPVWKVKREFLRICFKFWDWLFLPVELVIQRVNDLLFYRRTTLVAGDTVPGSKVAVFFIFQPKGLSPTIALTCRYLISQGYTLVLVSSTPLGEPELSKLRPLCWKILIRPNYGYDFGGYRDGIRVVRKPRLPLEKVLLLNDSMWFPLDESNQMIARLESDGLQLNGPVFENMPGREKHRHFQSYLLLIGETAWRSKAFADYWKRYKVSSRKRIVLARGEKGFSLEMFKAKFGGQAPSTRSILVEKLARQSNEFLRTTLTYAAYETPELATEAIDLLAGYQSTEEWHRRALAHMGKALEKLQPMGVFCFACTKLLDFSFLKKSSYPLVHDGMRWQYLRAVAAGDLPAPHPDILAEIKASRMDGRLTTDPAMWPRQPSGAAMAKDRSGSHVSLRTAT
jgi:Rhamnan synthesis protein F